MGRSLSNPPGGHGEAIRAILDALRKGTRFLVCSHERPDGDSVGSMLAFGMVLAQMGKQADLVTTGHISALYLRMPGSASIRTTQHIDGSYDAAILLECDSLERSGLSGLEGRFLINIDHHLTGSDYAALNWVDCEAASVGEMVHRLAVAAGARITPEMATCLYATLLTDTGGFSYGSIRATTFELARDLVTAGADPVRIAQEVRLSTPASKVRLLSTALDNLQIDGHVAWLWVTHQDMESNGADPEDSEGIVNFANGIAGVEAAAFLRETSDGHVRVSLRSKGELNVAAIAGRMGGGGHKNAAGCTVEGPLARALDEIPAILRKAVAVMPAKEV